MRHLGHTPAFRGRHGEPITGSVAEIKYLPIGGVDQWVMIRGENILNPALILLHGGPGFSETAMFRHFNAELEKRFTVVYWDQRGAGKSADPSIPRESMTVERFIADLDELVDVVCRRLGKKKVTIFGHSWGSALGVLYTARFPDKVAAYVGSGQVGDWKEGEARSHAYALARAEQVGNRKALRALRAMGPPPHTMEQLFAERTWVQKLDGQMSPRALWKLAKVLLRSKEQSILEMPATVRAFRASIDVMWPEVTKLNLLELAPVLKVPVFFLLGRHDHWVDPALSVAYFDALVAPSKRLVWFEKSGHEPSMDEPAAFNAAMIEIVRPVVAEDR